MIQNVAEFQLKPQFPNLTTRCHLNHNQHIVYKYIYILYMASSLVGFLFSALVAVLWRIRPNEIGKIKLGHKCVFATYRT